MVGAGITSDQLRLFVFFQFNFQRERDKILSKICDAIMNVILCINQSFVGRAVRLPAARVFRFSVLLSSLR